ncbi:hypothetical protein EG834_10510 [bacterium]|nr:hypothetical protein [bacterium]
MSLKFKRTLPLLLTLVLFLSVLAVFLGNQPLIPYTVKAQEPTTSVQADTLTTDSQSNLSLIADTLPVKSLANRGSVLTKSSTLSIRTTK